MQFLSIEPPQVAMEAVRRLARQAYGLEGRWRKLESERDLSFRISPPTGEDFVLKIANRHESPGIVRCQVEALEHIARTDPTLPVPRLRRTLEGEAICKLEAHDVHVLSWLPGTIVAGRRLGPGTCAELGGLLARLGKALRGFIHPAPAARELIWDTRLATRLSAHTHLLSPAADRELAEEILDGFRDRTLPRLEGLRAQIIHGDVHPFNILGDDGGAITGIIDFGDLVHAPLIQDLANAAADFLETDADNDGIIAAMIRGYIGVTALEDAEIAVLLDLIEVRLLMTVLVNRIREANGSQPDNYLVQFGARCFPLLRRLRSGDRKELLDRIRQAAGLASLEPETPAALDDLMSRRQRVLGKRLYHFYDPPLHLVKGEGVWLSDAGGRRYLDCYNNVPHVGHCHPHVAEAIVRQVRRLNTNTRYLTDQAIAYGERLVATSHPDLTAVAYVNSGSEANDLAWRMAKAWTGRRGGLCMAFAYHGITEATDAFSPSNAPEAPLAAHIRTLPPPDDYRGPFRRGEADLARRYAELADAPIADLQARGLGVAALMLDSAFMTNGMLEAPAGYMRAVLEKVHAAGGLFIADEVQSGFGRMGTALWGYMHHGIAPDIVTLGKPAGNGHPLGVVITRPEILDRFMRDAAFFSTFGGNNVSCAAGIAVLDVIRDEDLIVNARTTGAYLKAGLVALMDTHAIVGDVRGTGLALGMELVRDRRTLEPAKEETARVLSLVRDEGVLIGGEGQYSNILKIRPPIVLTSKHADIAIAALDRALSKL